MRRVQHSNILTLTIAGCRFDSDAMHILRNFLHKSSNTVYLRIHLSNKLLLSSEEVNARDPSWLANLVGPSVCALAIYYRGIDTNSTCVEPNLTDLMDNCRYSLLKLELKHLDSERGYKRMLERIPNLMSLKFDQNQPNPVKICTQYASPLEKSVVARIIQKHEYY